MLGYNNAAEANVLSEVCAPNLYFANILFLIGLQWQCTCISEKKKFLMVNAMLKIYDVTYLESLILLECCQWWGVLVGH